jgi:fluoride exporter
MNIVNENKFREKSCIMLQKYVFIGLAGAAGSVVRFILGTGIDAHWIYNFPLGTLVVNLIGCFILGWLTTFIFQFNKLNPSTKAALGTGLVGSFTTFSAFSVETVELILEAEWLIAFLYMIISMTGGLLISWSGYRSGRNLWERQNSVMEDEI